MFHYCYCYYNYICYLRFVFIRRNQVRRVYTIYILVHHQYLWDNPLSLTSWPLTVLNPVLLDFWLTRCATHGVSFYLKSIFDENHFHWLSATNENVWWIIVMTFNEIRHKKKMKHTAIILLISERERFTSCTPIK